MVFCYAFLLLLLQGFSYSYLLKKNHFQAWKNALLELINAFVIDIQCWWLPVTFLFRNGKALYITRSENSLVKTLLFLDTNYQGLSCEYFLFRAKKAEEELERAKELLKRREPPEELRRSLSKEDREILRQSVFINVKEKNEIEILKLKIIVSQSLCAPLEVRWGKWHNYFAIKRCYLKNL